MTAAINYDSATHVAGPAVKMGRRTIQRCCICGEKLADNEDAERKKFWNEGELVKIECGFLRSIKVGLLSVRKVPGDFCIRLVER